MSASEAMERGRGALRAWSWAEARSAFEEAVRLDPTAEAYEELATAAALLDDGATAISAREAAFRLHREAGDDPAAARTAVFLAVAVMDYRAEAIVASG